MIENFLRSVWKRGGLAGSTPEEAYEVHVGLGDTMTADDLLEGILRVRVLVAISRPMKQTLQRADDDEEEDTYRRNLKIPYK